MSVLPNANEKIAFYFDVGGVLMKDYLGPVFRSETFYRIAKVIPDLDPDRAEQIFVEMQNDLDINHVTIADLSRAIGVDHKKFTKEILDIHQFFPDRIQLIYDLASHGHKVGLASNFSSEWLLMLLQRITPLLAFDAICCSGLIGVAKPSQSFFKKAQKMIGTDEVLFVDDRIVNTEAAFKFGWKIILAEDDSWVNMIRRSYLA